MKKIILVSYDNHKQLVQLNKMFHIYRHLLLNIIFKSEFHSSRLRLPLKRNFRACYSFRVSFHLLRNQIVEKCPVIREKQGKNSGKCILPETANVFLKGYTEPDKLAEGS